MNVFVYKKFGTKVVKIELKRIFAA